MRGQARSGVRGAEPGEGRGVGGGMRLCGVRACEGRCEERGAGCGVRRCGGHVGRTSTLCTFGRPLAAFIACLM